MAKRIFKNKHLVRNILILAVLLFIGFFVWRALFKNTKIFEGQQGQQFNVDRLRPTESALSECDSIPNQNDLIGCLTTNLKFENRGVIADVVDDCEKKFPNDPNNMENCIVNGLNFIWYKVNP